MTILTMKQNHFVYFCIISSLLLAFVYTHNTSFYKFDTEECTNIAESKVKFLHLEENPLMKLMDEQRRDLCTAAKNYHSPLMDKFTIDTDFRNDPRPYWITYPDYSGIHAIGLLCFSSPFLYLRVGDSDEEMKVMIVKGDILLQRPADSDQDYEFEMETFNTIVASGTRNDFPHYDLHPFVALTDDERKNLCSLAKIYASLDGMNSESTSAITLQQYSISYPRKDETIYAIAMHCSSIPESYLRLGSSDKKIKIMIGRNGFLMAPYTLKVVTIKPNQVDNSGELLHAEVQRNRLLTLYDNERLLVCIAAKKHIQQVIPVLYAAKAEKAKKFRFYLPHGEEEHVAFACPSVPIMIGNTRLDRKV